MRPDRLLLAVPVLLALAVSHSGAQEGASRMTGMKLSGDEPIQIESDRLEVREAESVAVFTGNVTVVQGDTLLKSGKMTVHYAKDSADKGSGQSSAGGGSSMMGSSEIERIDVDGKVYVKSKEQVATADAGTFDMETEVLVMTGKEVILTDGPNVIVGCKLTVQMKTGQAKLDGCGGGSGRVKGLLQPNSQSN